MESLVDAFLDFSLPLRRIAISEGQTRGHVVVPEDKVFLTAQELERKPQGTEYGREYKLLEEKKYYMMVQAASSKSAIPSAMRSFVVDRDRMSAVDDLTSVCTGVPNLEDHDALRDVYEKFDFRDKAFIQKLPIAVFQPKIVAMIAAYQTTIIKGATGCGKSTQVPQYILDDCYERNLPCNIIVTQPRRIAAISVAKRVCQERNWELGSLVGYQVGLDTKNVSDDTRMTFCTTGVLLQILINEKSMNRYTHVIIDEVHERSQDMDFVIIIIKKLLRIVSPGVKVILMSATFNVEQFSEYFMTFVPANSNVKPIKAPIIDLDKQADKLAGYKLAFFYLEQLKLLPVKMPEVKASEPCIAQDTYQLAASLVKEFDRTEEASKVNVGGGVLIFLPGINEIEELFKLLTTDGVAQQTRWWIKPLHSTITTDEQAEVFQPPPPGHRKIILSTNIAESSITVPDIKYVIDFCLTKHLICDPNTNFSSLQLAWASKANCIQRAGRAGRLCDGRVFRLIPRDFFEELEDQDKAEMLRGPLERVVLLTKLLDMGEPKAILGLAIDPPDLGALEKSILLLKEKGALLPTLNGDYCVSDGDMTFLGRVMAKLPVDPVIAKLILIGHVFSMLKECVIMGAAMTLKSVFSAPFLQRLEAYHNRLSWADSSCSDCISFLNAYTVWRHLSNNGYFQRSVGDGEAAWAARNFIQIRAMHEVHLLVLDLNKRLKALGIEESAGNGRVVWNPQEKPLVLKIVLAGAFYPNYFVRGEQGGLINEQEAVKKLDGLDPFTTVYITGFPTDQPKELYAQSLKRPLKNCASQMMVSFDNSSKAYVQFANQRLPGINTPSHKFSSNIPGKIVMGVYRAIKLRQLNIKIKIPMLKPEEAKERAKRLGLFEEKKNSMMTFKRTASVNKGLSLAPPILPKFNVPLLRILISHKVDVGHFWAQNMDIESTSNQAWFLLNLNDPAQLLPLSRQPVIGHVYAAPFNDGIESSYYRAKVVAINPRKNGPSMIEVHFVDYGNTTEVMAKDMRDFGPELLERGARTSPPLAFECVLANVRPSIVESPNGLWSPKAREAFARKINEVLNYAVLCGKVYSVVFGVVSLELMAVTSKIGRCSEENLNEWLIRNGYAEVAEESFSSQLNHTHRQQSGLQKAEIEHLEQQQQALRTITDVESPDVDECSMTVTLNGPISPLEMKLYCTTRIGGGREVAIEQSSVNSVLLDTDPQDTHERLLIAACVSQNASGGRISLRHTTLMPNIHGLPAMLSLIFAPTVLFRVDRARTHYTGALCGLGSNHKTGGPVFPENDVEVCFDTEISNSDIQEINKLRYWMNQCFVTEEGQDTLSEDCTNVLVAQNKIKMILFKLLKQPRKSIPIELARMPYRWVSVLNPKYQTKPSNERLVEENMRRGVFRYHWGVQLRMGEEDKSRSMSLLTQVDQLRNAVDSGIRLNNWTTCQLCQYSVINAETLNSHLNSVEHEQKEENLRFRLQQDAEETD